MEIARFAVAAVPMIAAGIIAVRLWSGAWLFLVARPETVKKQERYPEGTRRSAQRASWVMVACFAVIATLMAFGMGEMSGNDTFVLVAGMLNNVALVAYCACVVWTFLGMRKDQGERARFKGSGTRLTLLLLATCVVLTLMSLLFA